MSQINVVSSTQRIVVNPASSGVQVVNAGPQGPAGVQGEPGEDALGYIADEATVLEGTSNTELVSPLGLQAKIDSLGPISPFLGMFTTAAAPAASTVVPGHYYFDTTVNGPFWSNGVSWVGGGTGEGGGGGPLDPPTGATAGAPGNFTPPGSATPSNLAQLITWDPTANPATPWDVGDHVILEDDSHAHWDGDSWEEGNAEAVPLSVGLTATPGSLFEPWVGLTAATDISWRNSSNVELATGTTPSFTVPGNGIINLVIDDGSLVEFLNFGFDNTQDQSPLDSLSASYNWEPTTLTGVTTSLAEVPNLKYFMAATPSLGGALIFGGHPTLEYVECYMSQITASDLTGCDSLIRLCYEATKLSELDLTSVRLTLRDLRCADQSGVTALDLTCTGDLPVLNHYCTQGNSGGTDIPLSQMPNVSEWWVWDKGLTTLPGDGSMPVSPKFRSPITHGNSFSTTTVDNFLEALAQLAWNNTDAAIGASTHNSAWNHAVAATAAANGAIALMKSRSWEFPSLTTAGDLTSDGVWPANSKDGSATGWARVGGGDPVAVYEDQLTLAWSGYSRIQRATPDGASTNDVIFTVTADRQSFLGGLWGLYARAASDGSNGARILLNGVTGAISGIGLSGGAFTGNATVTNLSPVPAGWTNAGAHTVQMRVVGNQITVALDGTDCFRATPSPSGGAYSGYYFGMCGDSSRMSRRWSDFTLA